MLIDLDAVFDFGFRLVVVGFITLAIYGLANYIGG